MARSKETHFEIVGFSRYRFVIVSSDHAEIIRKADGKAIKQTVVRHRNSPRQTKTVFLRRDDGKGVRKTLAYIACLAQLGLPSDFAPKAFLVDDKVDRPRWVTRSVWARHKLPHALDVSECKAIVACAEKMLKRNALNFSELGRKFAICAETARQIVIDAGL